METLLQQIIDLLTKSQGSLVYHLVLAFSVISSLQAAWIGRRHNTYQYTGRLVFGLCMLLLGQVILFVSSALAWPGIINEHLFLPPLDRAVFLFSLVWIVWLWNFPAPARLGDLVTAFLNLGVVLLFLFTFTSWSAQATGLAFNGSWMDMAWELAALFVVLTGMALLLFSRPFGWEFGMGMLVLSLAGIVAHLLLSPSTGDLSGYLRLGQLAAFPLLTTLLNRYTAQPQAVPARAVPETAAANVESETGKLAPVPFPRKQERRRYSTDPRTLHAWLEMSNTTDPDKRLSSMARAIAQSMLSDLCFIVSGVNFGHVVLQRGYDLIREEEIKGTQLEQNKLPLLSAAMQRGKPLRFVETDAPAQDLITLSSALGLKEAGTLMYVPLFLNERPEGGLLFLSPYSYRQWSAEDQNFLASELELIAQILENIRQQSDDNLTKEHIATGMRGEMEKLRQENVNLLAEISQLHQTVQQNQPAARQVNSAVDLSALIALQQETQDQLTTLQAENERLQISLKEQGISVLPPAEFKRMEEELRATLQEIALLHNELAEANARNMILEREIQQAGSAPGENHAVVVSVVQEIRQPMSSIIGYTDLLLAESVGLLGSLQRKFLERIHASTERMRGLLDDLIQITTMGEGPVEMLPQPVELATVIDGAIADTTAQLREKNIALRVDIPEDIPQINVDRDAVQQIVLHLLQNAGVVTPPEGTIIMRARLQNEGDALYLLMQVTDTGGGVAPDDLPRVFARRYRADLPLIEGLGDTGVGLSIAKTLVEAHGGRIWVESVQGQSTTFSVLLPLQTSAVDTSQK